MKRGHTFFVLGAAGAACAAIAIGIVTNTGDDLDALVEAPPMEILAASHTMTYEAEPTVVADAAYVDEEREIGLVPQTPSVAVEVALAPASPEVEATQSDADPEAPADRLVEARVAFLQHDYETTVQALEPMAAAGDPRLDVHYLLGLAQRYLGRPEASETAMQRALEIQPNNVRVLVNSARALLELDRASEAEARLRHAIDIAPTDGDAWNVLGRVQFAQGAVEEAEASFVTATEVSPTNAWAFNNLGYARLQREAWSEAAEALEQAIALRDDLALSHNNRGVALERLEKLEEAARAYARALQLQPDHARAQVSLARVAELVGKDVDTLLAVEASSSESDTTTITVEQVETPQAEELKEKSSEAALAADVGIQP
jgi:tetratricopeptide (TPR) repeat protein